MTLLGPYLTHKPLFLLLSLINSKIKLDVVDFLFSATLVHMEDNTHYIAIDILGKVHGIFNTKAEVEALGYPPMRVTPDAEALALRLGNVIDSDCFFVKRFNFTNECIMYLGSPEDANVDDILTFKRRILAMQLNWDKIESIKLTDQGDKFVYSFMKRTDPKWDVYTFTPDSAALIANARLECADEKLSKPIFIASKNNTSPLFLTVMELIYIPNAYQEASVAYHCSLMITPSSSIRLILSLAVLNGRVIDLNGKEMPTDSAAHKVYIEAKKFLSAFTHLQECSNTPLIVRDKDEGRKQKLAKKGIVQTRGVSSYNVSLTKRYKTTKHSSETLQSSKEGKELCLVNVSGFIRNQPCGEGRKERKLIWVDSFIRGQWVKSGLTYVTVNE